ncbi:MAG: helix-turn-helix domain-containing protein [Ignavibacteriaceae bacterium]
MKEFFSVQEIAKLLKLSRSTILYYIKTGKLKAVQVGKVYVISRENFGSFLKDQKHKKKDSEENQTHLDF